MSKVTCDMAMSIDGYVAGFNQRFDAPFGDGVEGVLHRWMFEAAEENADELRRITEAGAYIMGRNMFTPGRGEWDPEWTGWWGAEPPYHGPVFVLTHFPRESVEKEGGTTFHFVTGGMGEAFERAKAAAGDRSISITGGAATVNQFLAAGLIDELRLHVAPVMLGQGERLFDGVGRTEWQVVEARHTGFVTHVTYARTPA
ncbi:dihydrofolate reductase family protein [Actinokineospora enzanensis]|uniref:dihydrofolate reductase family protein n=1 Tax=Actinokineospora enzanensis TaxID=155975 RepID=UPI00038288C4|nr:dihydrofolate reductase family protein [Actinokineospora enzanensis]